MGMGFEMHSESLHIKGFAHPIQFLLVLLMLLFKQLVQGSLPDLGGRAQERAVLALCIPWLPVLSL